MGTETADDCRRFAKMSKERTLCDGSTAARLTRKERILTLWRRGRNGFLYVQNGLVVADVTCSAACKSARIRDVETEESVYFQN